MKKNFKLLAIAAIASLTVVACNNNAQPADSTADTTATEQVAAEEIAAEPVEVLDTTPVVEEQTAPAAKKATAKKKVNTEVKGEIKAATNEVQPSTDVKKMETPADKKKNLKKRL